jgi:hypothetical protein
MSIPAFNAQLPIVLDAIQQHPQSVNSVIIQHSYKLLTANALIALVHAVPVKLARFA